MPNEHREVEANYDADPAFELPSLTELIAGDPGEVSPPRDVDHVDEEVVRERLGSTYFDTADLRLAAADVTLKRSTGGADTGWQLIVKAGDGANPDARLELGRAARTVPAPLRNMVLARSRGAALVPVARIETQRTSRRLVQRTGKVLAEVTDDLISAHRLLTPESSKEPSSITTAWRKIHVRVVEGDRALLGVVDARLRKAGLATSDNASNLDQFLDSLTDDANVPGQGRRKDLSVKSSASAVVVAHLREQAEELRNQDLLVRLDAPEGVHKMRVASRRLRSALTTFKPIFVDDTIGPLRDELKWLAGELGAARDAEVMHERLRRGIEAENADELLGAVTQDMDTQMELAYRQAHDRVLADLDSSRYRTLLTALDELVDSPPSTKKADRPARKALPPLVARSYAKVRHLMDKADARPGGAKREELLHEARKASKRARYAAESVSSAFGKPATAFAAVMEGMQEELGEHRDSVVTRQRLLELAREAPHSGTAFTYGRLHALEEARGKQIRRHFLRAWKSARKKSVHRWLT
ncbi:CYTH and CHAD domain-containing protein [Pengzhenrongella sp.]|jgi:CHAD domain-containing protein|uniref:CYTH and CHAD domain-containing protein n=1 Tax=Pengzhenrongella sp. TaxID=2888820 RepID=UPI002F91E3D8